MSETLQEYQAFLVRIWSAMNAEGVIWRASITKSPFSMYRNRDLHTSGGKMVNIQAEKHKIEQMLKRVEAAENRHDVDLMLEDMTDDPLLHVCAVPPVKGQTAVRQLYHEFFKTFVSTNITSQQIHISSSGDIAWDFGSYVNEFQGPEGRITEEGKYLGIYHQMDGKWKAAAFCITPNG